MNRNIICVKKQHLVGVDRSYNSHDSGDLHYIYK